MVNDNLDNLLLNEADKHMNEELDFNDVLHAIGEKNLLQI